MEIKEIKEKPLSRPFHVSRLPYWITAVYGLLNIFIFFIPFVYTDTKNVAYFVNGFQMIDYLQDTGAPNLYYGTATLWFGYILGAILLVLSVVALFLEQKNLKHLIYFVLGISVIKFGIDLYSIIAIAQCTKMNIHTEFGYFLNVILSGLIAVAEVILFIVKKTKKN